jgi:hypothetical protein
MNTAFSLSDSQLRSVMDVAAGLDVDKRGVFLERCAARLRLKTGSHFADADLDDAMRHALKGLVQDSAA